MAKNMFEPVTGKIYHRDHMNKVGYYNILSRESQPDTFFMRNRKEIDGLNKDAVRKIFKNPFYIKPIDLSKSD